MRHASKRLGTSDVSQDKPTRPDSACDDAVRLASHDQAARFKHPIPAGAGDAPICIAGESTRASLEADPAIFAQQPAMSLADIYRDRRTALERYLRRFLGNAEEAADVAQEAFLKVYAAEIGHQTPVSEALLYTAARNLALSELRKRTSRATDAMGDMSELSVEAVGADPEAIASNRQMIASVETAMKKMSPRCLAVFRLRKLDELSHIEIALQMGMTTKSVERHMTHALQLCHEALTNEGSRNGGRRSTPQVRE